MLAVPALSQAQVIEIPEIRELGGGAISIATGGNGRSVQVSVNNGIKTIKAVDGEERCEIVDDPDNGITVKLTQQFGPDDADKIEKSMPGLYMHLKSIPKNVDGAKVDVHIDVTREFEADDKEELEAQHPEAFKVYEKYANAQNRIGFGIRPLRMRPIELPAVVDLKDIEEKMKAIEGKMMEQMKELRIPEVGGVDWQIIEVEDEKKDSDKEKSDEKQSKPKTDKKEDKKKSERRDDT